MGGGSSDTRGAGLRVLLLSCDGPECRAVCSRLESLGFSVHWEAALHCALDLHQEEDFDAWLVMGESGEGEGMVEAVERLHDLSPRTPIVVLAGPEEASWAIRALGAGADHYQPCDRAGSHLEMVGRVCTGLVELARLREARSAAPAAPVGGGPPPAKEGLERVLAGMVHDVRTPIGIVTGYAQRLARQLEGQPGAGELIEMARRIRENGEHAIGVLARWRAVASIECDLRVPEAHRFKLLPEMSLIAEIACDQARRAPGDVLISVDEHAALEVVADQQQIRDICVHLIDNGLRHGGPGKVAVSVTAERQGDGMAQFEFRFSDRGPGIPAESREAVFDPGVRLEQAPANGLPGPGLGLTIARGLARGLGGEVDVRDPDDGVGACVVLVLPIALAKAHD